MAVVNTKSLGVTNADARQPNVAGLPYLQKAPIQSAIGSVEVAAADDDNSTYRLCRIPSGARIHKIDLTSDAITGGTSYDIGLYNIATILSGAVVDADFFAAAMNLSAGNTIPVEVTFGNALDMSKIEQRLWQILGLTADPFIEYDVVLTANTAGSGAGTISLRVEWVI